MSESSEIWERAHAGEVLAVIGAQGGVPSPPSGWRVLRVHCGGPPRPLGPLLQARDQVDRLADMRSPIFDLAASRVRTGLRRRLLSDSPQWADAGAIVSDLNRFTDLGPGRSAIILEAFEAVDPATLALVRRLVEQRGWLKPALLLSVRREPQDGPVAELIQALDGAGAALRLTPGPGEAEAPTPARLAPVAARVIRAGAVVGEAFEVGLLASLLAMDELRVLEALQEALDAGVPLEDLGNGCFRLPGSQVEALRGQLMPSLARAWNRRVAELLTASEEEGLGGDAADEVSAPEVQSGAEAAEGPEPAPAVEAAGGPEPAPGVEVAEVPEPAPGVKVAEVPEVLPAPDVDGIGVTELQPAPDVEAVDATELQPAPAAEPAPEPPDPARDPSGLAVGSWTEPAPAPSRDDVEIPLAVEGWTSEPAPEAPRGARGGRGPLAVEGWTDAPAFGPRSASPRRREAEQARAAGHFAEAGELEEAVERYLGAVREAPLYALPQTLSWLASADALLDSLPESPRRLQLRARVELERGRLRWLGAGQGPELHLDGALASLERAWDLLDRSGEATRLRATLRTLIAQVCYDRGDAASLERALRELGEASRELQAFGDARAAARLLNDQAAVWVRIGDVVRAAHLLRESRGLFSRLPDPSEEDRAELAETDHLLARLPLHVASRPGLEADALRQALTHARQAEALYGELGWGRDRARTWETMGRLFMRLGEVPAAHEALLRAVEAQQASGDALGLARSAASLSQLMATAGQGAQALELLAASVQLNLRMHSPQGLAYNREALEALGPEVRGQLGSAVDALTRQVVEAGRRLGLVEA